MLSLIKTQRARFLPFGVGGGDSDDMLEGKKETTLELNGECMTETLILFLSELCNDISSVTNEIVDCRYKVVILSA